MFELANNHVWQTQFGFRQFNNALLPRYADVEADERGLTEWGWIESGFRVYYSLLNCGFRMSVTAGTASGVHPVPLGFGRVYVQLDGKLTVKNWLASLKAGRSFVTTGPMLFARVNEKAVGGTIQLEEPGSVRVTGAAESAVPLDRIEIVVNGEVKTTVEPANLQTKGGGYLSKYDEKITLDESSWIAVRTFEKRADKRVRFAHTNPIHVEVAGRPLRPRKLEAEYFVRRMQEEIARNQGVLSNDAVKEFRQALKVYQAIAETARP